MVTFRQIISNPGIDMLIGEEGDIEVSGFHFNLKVTSSVALNNYQYFKLQQFCFVFKRAGNNKL